MSDFEDRLYKKPMRTILGLTVRAWVIVAVVLVLGGITTAALWAGGVFTSDIKGQGDAQIIKNSAPNRVGAQQSFEDLYAEIKASDKNINVTAANLKKKPGDAKLETELSGQMQYCNGLVGEYNADARKFLMEQFRSADLPHQIDDSDPATDCKENDR